MGVRRNHDAENNIGAKGMNRLAESVLRGHHLPHLRVLIVHCGILRTLSRSLSIEDAGNAVAGNDDTEVEGAASAIGGK